MIDRPALKAQPDQPYAIAEWKRCRVALDYRVEIADHYYSVPFRLIRQEVEARVTDRTVEILHKGFRLARHARAHTRPPHHDRRADAECAPALRLQEPAVPANTDGADWKPSRPSR